MCTSFHVSLGSPLCCTGVFGGLICASTCVQRVCEDLHALVDHLHDKVGCKFVGTVGFCWGGKYSLVSASQSLGAVQAAVVVHGSRLTAEDGEAVQCPVLMLNAEQDEGRFPEVYASLKETLPSKDSRSGYHTFVGMSHGFALRGNPAEEAVLEAQQQTFQMTVDFYRKIFAEEE